MSWETRQDPWGASKGATTLEAASADDRRVSTGAPRRIKG